MQTTNDSGGSSANGQQQQQQQTASRPARSRNGCLTCRRRKVRCDEQRPRCSHCERLNLQCRWRPVYATPTASTSTAWRFINVGGGEASPDSRLAVQQQQQQQQFASPDESTSQQMPAAPTTPSPSDGILGSGGISSPMAQAWLQNPGAVDQLFDYASFMWDPCGDQISPETTQPGVAQAYGSNSQDQWGQMHQFPALPDTTQSAVNETARRRSSGLHGPAKPANVSCAAATSRAEPHRRETQMPPPGQLFEDHDLISYFVRAIVPPILAEVETQKRWTAMRQILISMSNTSAMVKCAILAFSGLLYHRRETPWMPSPQHHYDSAVDELVSLSSGENEPGWAYVEPPATSFRSRTTIATPPREQILATLFFLTYVDILEDRVDNAHRHLKRAYGIFQSGSKKGFRSVEIRLLSWIRLLDARAVSAGGEGLFLSDSSEALIIQPSPTSAEVPDTEHGPSGGGTGEVKEWDIEDVLFQVLYHPGIIFFQKVQSFMGRISKIDLWHRSRGTVEDEMEVMQIAHRILKDLRDLYDERPTLMDHAVEGRLTPPHISAGLATAITRAFRTYLSNYHASKVHLHRVAYKHLALSRETLEALRQIRRLTKQLVEALGPGDALPVSQLWPLVMLGSEETDPVERAWIKTQILQMEKVATNARITAHVLEEVQARQDASNGRVDIRSVMHAIFDSCFAIM